MNDVVHRALNEKRTSLLEHETFSLLKEQGLPVPRHRFLPVRQLVPGDRTLAHWPKKPSVLKIVSEKILHKSNVGGVVFLDAPTPKKIRDAAKKMITRLPPELKPSVRGILLEEAVSFEPGPGRELYLGMRQTREFGLVSTIGFGGTYIEALEKATRSDQSTIVFKPDITTKKQLRNRLEDTLFFRWTTGQIRGVKATSSARTLWASIEKWMAALNRIRAIIEDAGAQVQEMEINPLVFAGKWTAVDALVSMKPTDSDSPPMETFPMANLKKSLKPKRVATVGVSRKMNIGRTILRSMLDGGYPKSRVSIIREGVSSIDGVACIPSLSHLKKDVDLFIVAVAATRVPAILADAFDSKKVRAVLLIPDGMAKGTKSEQKVRALIAQHTHPNRPVIIGNNSLGFVSKKARFDSLFVPKEKLPRNATCTNQNVAMISQSGAFLAMTLNKLSFLCPAYQISVGNQLDARLSHYLEVLTAEKSITTFALYIEGLKQDDGLKIAGLIKKIVGKSSGNSAPKKDVIVYKAGRSDLGQTAAMGHTAAVAGNWRIFQTLMGDAGAMVAETFDDFLGLVRLSSSIGNRPFSGRRTAMMTNAGCEAVGMADNHQADSHTLFPATFSKRTTKRITEVLKAGRMDKLVRISNPMDLTPMANDAVHNTCMRAMIEDPGVDVALFGCSPFTSTVQSLSRDKSDRDIFDAPGSYANLTIDLFNKTTKPFVVIINGGRDYDAMVTYLEQAGIPVFRSADEATRILGLYIESKIGSESGR